MKASLVVSPRYKAVVQTVSQYGYDFDGKPNCNNEGCHSELSHLIDDWRDNSTDLKDEQAALGLSNIQFEKLLATIYGADEIKITEVAECK